MNLKTLLGAGCLLLALEAEAAPFPTRDQNPLVAAFGLPLPLPAALAGAGETRIDTVFNWSNTANSQAAGNEAILFDLESREVRIAFERRVSRRMALRLQVPYRRLNAGVLDSFIDGWHDAVALPEGARVFLPRDEFRLTWFRDGRTLVDLREPVSGLGDVSLEAGYQWLDSNAAAISFWVTAEAPTGSRAKLLGNGEWDFGLHLAGRHAFGSRGAVHWQAGATRPGAGGPLASLQKDWAASASGSIEYGVWRGLFLKAQVDAHTAVFESEADLLGSAVILTLGGDYRFASGWLLDIGITEDVEVAASPDVNFCFALRKSF